VKGRRKLRKGGLGENARWTSERAIGRGGITEHSPAIDKTFW
jgi:hypothetical protein